MFGNPRSPLSGNLYLIFFFWLGSAFLYSFISLVKHWHFQTGLDLAIYNQILWFYSHLKLPYVTLWPTFGRLVFADHFTPTLSILAPFYGVFPQAETLLVIQSFFFTSGIIPLYLLSKEKTGSLFFSWAIVLSYLLFFGTQFALTFDFHAATFGASFLPWILYAMEKSRWKIFSLLTLLALGTKEDMALTILSLGIFMTVKSKWCKMGLTISALAIIYFVTVVFLIIPSFSGGLEKEYLSANLPVSLSGWPGFLFSSTKLKTLFLSFTSFGFLPALAPSTWIFPFMHFLYNFLGPQGRGEIYLHYRVALAPLLAYSSIYGVLKLATLVKKYSSAGLIYKLSGAILIFCLLLLQYALHLPINTLSKRDFYLQKEWMRDNEKLIKMIPSNASISTQNHFAPHLSGRPRLYYFPAKEDYVLLDLRENQPIVDFWASPPPHKSREIIKEWMEKGEYKMVGKSGEAVLLSEVE